MHYFQDIPVGGKLLLHLNKDNKFLVLDAVVKKHLGNNISIIDIKSPNKDNRILNFNGIGIYAEYRVDDYILRFLKCKIVRHNGEYNIQVLSTGVKVT